MHLDLQAKGAVIDGRLVPLTRSEQALLAWLVSHPGAPQSRDVLLRQVWGYARGARSRTVDSTMNRLRTKLDEALGPGLGSALRTIRGRGWVYAPPTADGAAMRFVGRGRERAALATWFDGGGALLTVTGEPGIGKTALVAHAGAPRVVRVDADTLRDADDWYRAVDGLDAEAIVWVDGADSRRSLLRAVLAQGAPRGRRLVVTCRRPLGVPGEALLPLGPLAATEAEALAGAPTVDDNPLVIVGPLSAVREALARALRDLDDPEHAALRRIAALPCPAPLALADRLAGDTARVAILCEAGLLRRDAARIVVPTVVRLGLAPADPAADRREAREVAERWVEDTVARVHRAGDVRWIPFVRGLGAELPVLGWVIDGGRPEAVAAALAALYDHHRLVDPAADLGPALDAAVRSGTPGPFLRRSAWRLRHGDAVGAEADLAAFERALAADDGREGARARLAGAMHAARDRDGALATTLAGRALAWAEQANDAVIEAMSRFVLAEVALDAGDPGRAFAEARAARSVAIGANRHGHTVTSFYARYLHEAGHDDAARVALAESHAIAVEIGFTEGVALSDAMAGWMAVVTARDPDGIARLVAACAALDPDTSAYAAGSRLRLGWAEIVAGSAERGLSILRSTLDPAQVVRPADVAHARAFAVAARIRLGLTPRAPWMPPADAERDPAVRTVVDGLEAAAAGDLAAARAAADAVRGVTTSRVRALTWVLRDQLG